MNFNNQVAAVGIPVDATDEKVNEANIVSSYPARPAPIVVSDTLNSDDELEPVQRHRLRMMRSDEIESLYHEIEGADEILASIRIKSCWQAVKVLTGGLIIVGGLAYFMSGIIYIMSNKEDKKEGRMPVWAVIVSMMMIGLGIAMASSGSKNGNKLNALEQQRVRQLRNFIRITVNTMDRGGFHF